MNPITLTSALMPYCSTKKDPIFDSFSRNLQEWLTKKFFSPDNPEGLLFGRSILDFARHCRNCDLNTLEAILMEISQTTDYQLLGKCLPKLLALCEKGWIVSFFECATTCQARRYSFPTLCEMVDGFEAVVRPSFPSPFPPYDLGGKECLRELAQSDLPAHLPTLKREDLMSGTFSYSSLKPLVIRYLSGLGEPSRFLMKSYFELFRELEVRYPLKEELLCRLAELIVGVTTHEPLTYSFADLKELLAQADCVYEKWGEEGLAPCGDVALTFSQIIRIFRLLVLAEECAQETEAVCSLVGYRIGQLSFQQLLESLDSLPLAPRRAGREKGVSPDKLVESMNSVKFPLPKRHLDAIVDQYFQIQDLCQKRHQCSRPELVNLASEVALKGGDVVELCTLGLLAIENFFQKSLHETQLLTVLAELRYTKGCVAQVRTGEGKSLIITLLAFVLAMQKKTVHIISSSHNLSVRDQEDALDFFRNFEIHTSHICDQFPPPEHFKGQILYGTAHDFEFAIMREWLYDQTLFPRRGDCTIIDELDNLTIDTACNHARLSFEATVSYDWVYEPIFQFVKQNFSSGDQHKLHGALGSLKSYLATYSGGRFAPEAAAIDDDQYSTWLSFAFSALHIFEEKRDYVVLGGEIVIVDVKNTGRFMHGSRWRFHGFVEVKHGITPEKEDLNPLALSHSVFYPMYPTIYGLTGTIGSTPNREEIKEIYGIDSFDIPTHLPSRRKDLPTLIFQTEEKYWEKIVGSIKGCRESGRPILVLCESIQGTEELARRLEQISIPFRLLNEMQEESEEEVIGHAGEAGAVTVATNTAGRGTNIILTEQSLLNGGLHVLLTFFPDSLRVEDQARGRAGRQGQDGSSQVMLCLKHLLEGSIPSEVPTDVILSHLHQVRESSARVHKEYSVSQAELQRFHNTYVLAFFKNLNAFRALLKGGKFMTDTAEALSSRKLLKIKDIDMSAFSLKQKQLREDAIGLLRKRDERCRDKWECVLRGIGEELVNESINVWSLAFNHLVEDLMQDSTIFRLASFKDEIAKLGIAELDSFEKKLTLAQAKNVNQLKDKIDALYQTNRPKWEILLDPTGASIVNYLRKLTGASLKGI